MVNWSLPEAKRVLVLAPHADDEAIGCGGTIALYALRGAEVHVAVVSDGAGIAHEYVGEGIDIVTVRRQEAIEASNILGVGEPFFLGFPDGKLGACRDDVAKVLEKLIEEYRPDIIFAPSPIDYHEDHITCSRIAISLKKRFLPIPVAFYEVYATVRFNALVNISEVMHLKEKALLAYKYSLFGCPDLFSDAVKGMNIYRSFYTREKGLYEAFWIVAEPVENESVMRWYTYDQWSHDPASEFLSKLKVADELLFEIKKSYAVAEEKEAVVRNLTHDVKERDKKIAELNASLDIVQESLIWKLAKGFYRYKERFLPEGTGRRRLYDSAIRGFKSRMI